MTETAIAPVPTTTSGAAGVRERSDLQRLLREHVHIVAPETLIIAEEFGSWDASYRRIDCLASTGTADWTAYDLTVECCAAGRCALRSVLQLKRTIQETV